MLGNLGIGTASINGGALRGEGGALHPQLVVPLKIDLNNYPAESMIAVYRVTAKLSSDRNVFPGNVLCQPAVQDLIDNLPVHSLPQGHMNSPVELRFWLTTAEVEHIEGLRHASPDGLFALYVKVVAGVAGMKTYNQMGQAPLLDSSWAMNHGMFSQMFPFWTCRVATIQVEIEQSTWVEKVLPGLGYDRLRLLELSFPPPLPDRSNAAAQFDKAKCALDQRRYGDCIQECRGLLNMWEKQYGATTKNLIADVVKADRGWSEGDIRRDLLDMLWKEIGDVANAPHHPEGNVNAELFNDRDARLILLLTAALSEYVERR
jgi:hypothetical protein